MAFGLPKSTEVNKKIPKQKFYENLPVKAAIKRVFVNDVSAIIWRNKIAVSTINAAPGKAVTEIEIFEIALNERNVDVDSILEIVDQRLPYHLIFLLECEGKYQARGSYKRPSASGKNAFSVETYYHTPWLAESDLTINIEGLNLDSIYENFIRQIAGDALLSDQNEPLQQSVERTQERKKIVKQIEALEKKLKKEIQFNKQVEINIKIKELNDKLERLGVRD